MNVQIKFNYLINSENLNESESEKFQLLIDEIRTSMERCLLNGTDYIDIQKTNVSSFESNQTVIKFVVRFPCTTRWDRIVSAFNISEDSLGCSFSKLNVTELSVTESMMTCHEEDKNFNKTIPEKKKKIEKGSTIKKIKKTNRKKGKRKTKNIKKGNYCYLLSFAKSKTF